MHGAPIERPPPWVPKALLALARLGIQNALEFSECPILAWHYGTVYRNTFLAAKGIKVDGPIAHYLDDRYQEGCGLIDCHQTWGTRVKYSGGISSKVVTQDCEDALGADCGFCCLTMPLCTYDVGIIPGIKISHAVGRLNGTEIRDLCVPAGMPGTPQYEKAVWLRVKG